MKISLERIALGTTALTLLISGSAFAFDPDTPSPVSVIDREDIENSGATDIADLLSTLPKVADPSGLPIDLIETSRAPKWIMGPYGVPISVSTKAHISYDSNICKNYGSGTFALPNPGFYDQRIVNEAMGYIDNLSDNQFLQFMDWLDGTGPEPLALRGSNLGRAMDAVDWMTDAEVDEIFWQTYDRDEDLYFGGPPRLKVAFTGIFAQALVPKTPLEVLGPRYYTPKFAGFTPQLPTMTIQQGLTEVDLTALKNLFNETGGGIVPPAEPGGSFSAVVPYKSLYNYDRFKLWGAYNYGLENNITDGSVPTIVNNNPVFNSPTVGGNPELEEEFSNSFTLGAVITPEFLPGFHIETGNEETPIKINPSVFRNWNFDKGGMTQIDPPTLELDAGDPIESVIPELSDPFRIEGHLGSDTDDAVSEFENLTPRIGLSYDIGPGVSLRIPFGAYKPPLGITETPNNSTTTTTERTPGTTYTSNIKFKIEESVFENNQINTGPAQEVVVKLGYPIPPMPLEGNPRIDDGASDDPMQGEVDAQGNFTLKYDYKDNFGLGLRADYDYSGLDDTEIGDGSPPTLTLIEPTDTVVERGEGPVSADETFTIPIEMIKLKLEFDGGMTQLDPPMLELDAGPSTGPIDSVMPDLQPYSLADQPTEPIESVVGDLQPYSLTAPDEPATSTPDTTPGDSRLQDRQTDINWQDVQQALGEFADIPAIDRMRDRDLQFEGGDTTPDTSTGTDESPFSWNDITPRIGLNYDLGTPDRVIIRSGIRGTSSDYDMDINMQPLGSKILYRTDPNADLGGLEDFSIRTFGIGKYKLDSIFYPLGLEPQIESAIKDTPGIALSEPNPYRDKQGNDPYYKSEGTWGQDYADQWAIQHVGFTEEDASAWAAAGGELEEVIVAVIDTGIDWNHADISWDSIWRNNGELPDNGIDDDGNGYIDDLVGWDFFLYNNLPWDEDGHGTFVTGIIAAISDNDTGISGINPAAKIMVLKSLDSFGHTRASYLAEAIVYAVDNGARIINLSVGGDGLSHAEELAVQYAEDHGVLVFAAAGNKGSEASNFGFVPYETVVTVGSTTRGDAKSNFSNWGEGIDIMAPGEDVLSLRARRTDLMLNVRHLDYEMGTSYVGDDKRYYRAAGTSFSVPIVAGIASLILSKNPDLTPAEVRRMLYQSARDVDVPGRDQQTGYGLVDAAAAINADPAFEIIADISGVEVIQEGGQVLVSVQGTASANAFDGAEISIGQGENPETWKVVGDRVKKPVSAGLLSQIPAGEFQGAPVWIIRVVVTHKNGKTREERFTLTLG